VDASNPAEVRPRITPIQRLSTLPPNFTPTNYVGEIKINPTGTHVYVSNRGHNSIAAFSIAAATGLLTREGVDGCQGKCPRHFSFSDDGQHAVVGVQDSDAVKVFKTCPRSGRLTDCVQELDAPTPNFVLFVKPHGAAAAAFADGAAEARERAASGSMARGQMALCCAN